MDYIQPLGEAANASYVDANPGTGLEGSAVPAASLENPQREIVAAIVAAGLVPDNGDLTQLAQAISALAAGRDVGDFFLHVGSTAPANSIIPNGATGLSRAAFPELFAHLNSEGLIVTEGTKEDWEFGDGDGATTFSMADWRGEFFRAFDGGRGVDIGRILASWQEDENKEHTHDAGDSPSDSFEVVAGGSSNRQQTAGNPNYHVDLPSETQPSGGVEARPRNIALLPCIQYK